MGKNKKVIFTIGIPGCGKTTWKNQFISGNPEFISIERDDLRMTHLGKEMGDYQEEMLITKISDGIAFNALCHGKSVIFSNTNTNLKNLKAEIEKWTEYADIEFVLFDVPVEECKRRNSLRDRKVPDFIIDKMATSLENLKANFDFAPIPKKPKMFDYTKENLLEDGYIFDLDGTLCWINHASEETSRGWYDYEKVKYDLIDIPVFEVMRALKNSGFKIVFLTGRYDVCRKETTDWIKDNLNIDNPILYMKPNNTESDVVFKKRIYKQEISKKWNILAVFEDRQKVVDMWREIGVKVFQCEKTT